MAKKIFADGDNCCIVFDDEHMRRAEKFWTEERMKNAKTIHKVLPFPEHIKNQELSVKLDVQIADVEKEPFNAGGKLFFTVDGEDYVGSAEYCADSKLLLTAGHCLYDHETKTWSENIVFFREYKGSMFEQMVPVRACAIKSAWLLDENYAYDYGFGISDVESEELVLGYNLNVHEGRTIAYGYPGNYFSGENMAYVTGAFHQYKSYLRMPGNSMGGGCSGGAWVAEGSTNAIGLNSFHYAGFENDEYSPIFDENFKALVDYAKSLK